MAVLRLYTLIDAPRERVFDLARSIDAHKESAKRTGEKAISGKTAGLIGLDEEVTWEARHFGVRQRLKVKITMFDRPNQFEDRMIEGAFKSMWHVHSFNDVGGKTMMVDRFEFAVPIGFLSRFCERFILAPYLNRFLAKRNQTLKMMAEGTKWQKYVAEA